MRFADLRWGALSYEIPDDQPVTVGRDAYISIDRENPYLHRVFLQVRWGDHDLLWLDNVGTRLVASVSDRRGGLHTWLGPGESVPLLFDETFVWFTAGDLTYDFSVAQEGPAFMTSRPDAPGIEVPEGIATVSQAELTPGQKLVVLALAEHALRGHARGATCIPASNVAAKRLGWPITTFNRKLDSVCDRLTGWGIEGLHGGVGNAASDRKARLVDYAMATRLVTPEDLALLPGEPPLLEDYNAYYYGIYGPMGDGLRKPMEDFAPIRVSHMQEWEIPD